MLEQFVSFIISPCFLLNVKLMYRKYTSLYSGVLNKIRGTPSATGKCSLVCEVASVLADSAINCQGSARAGSDLFHIFTYSNQEHKSSN